MYKILSVVNNIADIVSTDGTLENRKLVEV